MSSIHDRKRAVVLTVAGALAGGLAVYGVVWLGRRLAASSTAQRAIRLVALFVDELTRSAAPASEESETVFQADAAPTAAPTWTANPSRTASHYGPN